MGQALNTNDLARLEAEWVRLDHPVAGRLADGLSDGEIDELVGELPFAFPDELRTWWGWHNGVVPVSDPDLFSNQRIPPLMMPFIPLHDALETYRLMRQLSTEQFTDPSEFPDRDHWWGPNWFPYLADERTVACVCPVNPAELVSLKMFDPPGPDVTELIQTRSIGQAVNWWIDYMENGGFTYDPSADTWSDDVSKRPAGAEATYLLGDW